jgi:hypothetical protein
MKKPPGRGGLKGRDAPSLGGVIGEARGDFRGMGKNLPGVFPWRNLGKMFKSLYEISI